MRIHVPHRTLLAAATAVLALTLTACGGDGTASGAADGADAKASTGAPVDADAAKTPAADAEAGSSAAPAGGKAPQAQGSARGSAGKTGGGSADNTPEYAQQHPCAMKQLSLTVRKDGTRRVIEVANTGASACGLDLLPAVDLGRADDADRSGNLHPLVPGGLGGPDHALLAGGKAYAVLDLTPGGGGEDVDEMHVLVSPSHMPNAETRAFGLGSGVQVSAPRLGLYRGTVAEAVASMRQADTTQQ
ncbi:DUF4232 domain-containing protein [Streptomyces sp. CO7]